VKKGNQCLEEKNEIKSGESEIEHCWKFFAWSKRLGFIPRLWPGNTYIFADEIQVSKTSCIRISETWTYTALAHQQNLGSDIGSLIISDPKSFVFWGRVPRNDGE
jgi:hypothetical protein